MRAPLFLTVFSVLLSFAVMPSHAATPITDEMVEKYSAQCVTSAKEEGTMIPDSQAAFCACTGQHMKSAMTVEDLQAMQGKDQAARDAINKVLTDVNGPCMSYPIHDKVYKKCMADVGQAKTCECLSSGIATYLSAQSQTIMKDLLAKNPNMYDPMGEIMSSAAYQAEEKKLAMGCLTGSQH